jgi:RNA polymerase sigma-70 factor (sigma-E family)
MSFEEYVRQRLQALLRFAMVIACDPHLAEDIVQDVLARSHGRWARISSMDHPEAYLKRMVVNDYLSWRRRSRRVTPYTADALDAATSPAPDHAVAHGERDELMSRIAALPAKQRAVVALRYYDGHTDAEIAEILGCREATVRSQASRALATMRTGLPQAGPRRPDQIDPTGTERRPR